MKTNHVRARLKRGEPSVGTWLVLPNLMSTQLMARVGFDWLTVELEHSPTNFETASQMFATIAAAGVAPLCRVPWNTGENIKRVLDTGAWGVIVPMVSNRAEAERAVAACRYPPKGMRSNGPNRVLLYAGADYQKHANDEVACIVMVETTEGIEKIDEITATPGVDAVYIGPTDLALALGLPPVMDNDEPKHVATVNRILDACKRHKIVPGIHTASSKFTQRYLDQGFQMVMLGADRAAMVNFMKAEIGRLTGWTPLAASSASTGGY